MNPNVLNEVYLGLSVADWAIMAAVWMGTSIILHFAKKILIHRFSVLAERTHNQIDDIFANVFQSTRSFFILIIGAYVAIRIVTGDAPAVGVIQKIAFLGLLLQLGFWGNTLIDAFAHWYLSRGGEDAAATQVTAIKAFGMVGRLMAWAILILLALDNFGIDITALIAGLGIGGLAMALALRPLLEDIFAYFSIVVDRPFLYGDFIVSGEFAGTVEHVGIKTTRFISKTGEEIVFPNADLLSSRLRNYKKMKERRASFTVGVTYDTSSEKLGQIAGQIRGIIEKEENVRFDRGHLAVFGDSAIQFEFVYFLLDPSYMVFMDTQERVNLAIVQLFNKENIEFAFPTQTIHIESMPSVEQKS